MAQWGESEDAGKGVILRAKLLKSWVSERRAAPTCLTVIHIAGLDGHRGRPFWANPVQENKAPGTFYRQHLQDHSIDKVEDRRVGANPESKRKHHRASNTRASA